MIKNVEDVHLVDSKFREKSLGFIICNPRMNYHILSFLPVHWSRDAMFVPELESYKAMRIFSR